jgi:hypothetical protein
MKEFTVLCGTAGETSERKFTEEQVDEWMLPLSKGGSWILRTNLLTMNPTI